MSKEKRATTNVWESTLRRARIAASIENLDMVDFMSEAAEKAAAAVFKRHKFHPKIDKSEPVGTAA